LVGGTGVGGTAVGGAVALELPAGGNGVDAAART
jgi:hypothetical protein